MDFLVFGDESGTTGSDRCYGVVLPGAECMFLEKRGKKGSEHITYFGPLFHTSSQLGLEWF